MTEIELKRRSEEDRINHCINEAVNGTMASHEVEILKLPMDDADMFNKAAMAYFHEVSGRVMADILDRLGKFDDCKFMVAPTINGKIDRIVDRELRKKEYERAEN